MRERRGRSCTSPEAEVRGLVTALFERFPSVELMFDTFPRWLSVETLHGLAWTRHHTTPPLPWGISHAAIAPTLRGWSGWSGVVLT